MDRRESMNKKELIELIANIGEEDSVDDTVFTLENFKSRLENKEFKSFMDSEKDKHAEKVKETALDNFKKNDMKKLIDAEILKRNPQKTPEQLKIEELENKFKDMEKAKAKAEMVAKYKDTLSEKKIPSNLIDFLLGDNEETTDANITLFENSMKTYVDNQVKERISKGSYTPPDGDKGTGKSYQDLLDNADDLSVEEIMGMLDTLQK